MQYVLDTNVISDLAIQDERGKRIASKIAHIGLENILTTCINKAESDWGFKKIGVIKSENSKRKLSNTQALRRHLNILNLNTDIYLFIMEYRDRYGNVKGQMDMCDYIIGCICIYYGYTLITRDKCFQNMPELRTENRSK